MQRRLTSSRVNDFRNMIYDHYRTHGRNLPWRRRCTPYRVVVAEIMLQQTQAERVASKFVSFISAFPTFESLVSAPLGHILKMWQGLGYNRRAIALKKIAERVVNEYGGLLPSDPETLATFPGIGPATASSIATFAFNRPTVFIETNIRTVFIHCFFPGSRRVNDKEILPLVERTLDRDNPRKWYNALMDYGLLLKKRHRNPGRRSTDHRIPRPFQGSHRQVRGALVRVLTEKGRASSAQLARTLHIREDAIDLALNELEREGFITRKGTITYLA